LSAAGTVERDKPVASRVSGVTWPDHVDLLENPPHGEID
jgi:hypothetical protein